MTARPGGAAAPQGCAMDAGARPEPRAFGARLGGPGQAHLLLGPWGHCIRDVSASQWSMFVERDSDPADRPGG